MAKTRSSTASTAADPAERSAFSQFGERAGGRIESSPLIALAGGLAIGALIAALLRQSERELSLLRPAGAKIGDAGRQAVDRFREAGKAKVDELAGDKVREFFGLNNSAS